MDTTNVCKGTTCKGKPCKRTVKSGDYCCYHTPKPIQEKEKLPIKKVEEKPKKLYPKSTFDKLDECCVCIENLSDDDYLSCGHWIHTSCVVKSGKQECPICRAEIILTDQDKSQLEKIAKDRRDEEVEEQHRRLTSNEDPEIVNYLENIIMLALMNDIENMRIGHQPSEILRPLFLVYRRR